MKAFLNNFKNIEFRNIYQNIYHLSKHKFQMQGQQIHIQASRTRPISRKFIRKELIGSGGFAKCYLLIDSKNDEKYAAKVISKKQMKSKSAKNKVLQEIEIHRTLKHKHIVRLEDIFQLQGDVCILLQYCQNNSLKEFLKSRVRITQFEAKYYLHQILDGVQYLHQNNILHRDIKLGNIFLNFQMEVKIGDFGLSTKLKNSQQRKYTLCGTPNYIAPETLNETGHSFQADIWALGIILYAFLIGKPPFQSNSVDSTYKKIKSNIIEFPRQIPISNSAKLLIKQMLEPNPKNRITINKIRNHQFMNLSKNHLPKLMPAYTITLPPQNNFLKQYLAQLPCKISIYPKKIGKYNYQYDKNNTNQFSVANSIKDLQQRKLARVLSLDKNLPKQVQKQKSNSKLNLGFVQTCKHNIPHALSARTIFNPEGLNSAKKHQEDATDIICYYDISDKYGIGYILANGNLGIIFNDSTSLTQLVDGKYLYVQKSVQKTLSILGQQLKKKQQILKLCQKKLTDYRKNNVLIPYNSNNYVKKYIKNPHFLVLKLNNGIIQFFNDCDSITLRGYKWVKWKVGQQEGQSALSNKHINPTIQSYLIQVRSFLKIESQKSLVKAKYQQTFKSTKQLIL